MTGKSHEWSSPVPNLVVELDSLADISSFGFAPSILLYKAYFYQWDVLGIVVSFLPMLFGSIRLARYNVESSDLEDKDAFFKGLPIPSAAICLSTFVVFESAVYHSYKHVYVLLLITILVSVLMISRIRYESMPNFGSRKKQDLYKIAALVAILPLIVFFPSKTIFPIIMVFILLGIFRAIVRTLRPDSSEEIQDVAIAD